LSLPENLLSIDIEDAIVGPDDHVHLFWIARFEGTHLNELIHDTVSENGTLLKRTHVMSSQNHLSNVHSVVSDSGVLQVLVVDTIFQSYNPDTAIPGFEFELAVSGGFVVFLLLNKKRKN
jgi:hypothetical protein